MTFLTQIIVHLMQWQSRTNSHAHSAWTLWWTFWCLVFLQARLVFGLPSNLGYGRGQTQDNILDSPSITWMASHAIRPHECFNNFPSLMNEVFAEFLCKFVLLFFWRHINIQPHMHMLNIFLRSWKQWGNILCMLNFLSVHLDSNK